MDSLSSLATSPGGMVLLAAFLQTIAYLFQNQILMRVLLLIGTFLYLWYYFIAAAEPLWAAIYGSAAIAATSIFGFAALLIGRSKWIIPTAHRDIFEHFPGVEPRVFRKLMKAAVIRDVEAEEVLTEIGKAPDHLFYIISGHVTVEKEEAAFQVPALNFIGEISMLLGKSSKASAAVTAPAGTRLIAWPRRKLERIVQNDPKARISLEALLARDMAAKLARSRA